MNEERYPSLYAPKDGYVFVVTYGRSGSTLTQSLLNSIPGYCIRGENGNLLYHFSRAAAVVSNWDNFTWRQDEILKPIDQRRKEIADTFATPKDPWYGAENVNTDEFSRAMMDLFVREVLHIPEQTRVAGFKEIRFHEDRNFFHSYLETIKKYFPNSRFIFQTRDYSSVSQSGWWKSRNKSDVKAMVEAADQLYKNFSENNPSICYTIEYERYSEGTKYTRELFDFLRESPDMDKVSEILREKLIHCPPEHYT